MDRDKLQPRFPSAQIHYFSFKEFLQAWPKKKTGFFMLQRQNRDQREKLLLFYSIRSLSSGFSYQIEVADRVVYSLKESFDNLEGILTVY